MNGPWQVGWSGVTPAPIGWWCFSAGVRTEWPGVIAFGGTWLRRVWQAQGADEGDGAGLLQSEGAVTREILVIDDDKLTRQSLSKVFARTGCEMREAASAAEGIAAGFGSHGGHPLARPGRQISSPSPRGARRGSETKARRLGSHNSSNKD